MGSVVRFEEAFGYMAGAKHLDTRRFAGCLFLFRAEATRDGSPQGFRASGLHEGRSHTRFLWPRGNAEMHYQVQVKMYWKSSLDAAWHGTNSRDPSTQPHAPPVVRFSVGMTKGWGIGERFGRLAVHRDGRGNGSPQGLKPVFI